MDKNLRLLVRLDAIDKASRPMRGIEKQVRAASDALRLNRAELKKLEAAQRDVAAFRGLKASLEANKRAMLEAQAKAQALAREHAKVEAPTRKMTAALTKARSEVKALKAAQEGHARELNQVRGRLDAAGVSTRNLGREELALRNNITRANSAIDQQKTKLKALGDQQRRNAAARDRYSQTTAFAGQAAGAGAGALGAGMAVAAPVVVAGRAAIDFERAMAGVKKVVNFPTPKAFQQMSRDILDLSGRIPVASGELAGLVAQGARAGVARGDLLAYAEAAAKMGVAFDITSEEAGEMMAVWRTAFGLQQREVIGLADRVNYLTNSYGGNAAKVSEMITRVGPLADVAGASSSVLAGLAQVMNSVGVEAEVGGTGIKNMLLGLTKGAAATRMQRQAFAALGLDAGRVAKQMQTDAEGAITGVLRAVARLPKEQQLSVLGQLFGTESVAAIAPMLSQLDLVERNLREVGDASISAGSMQREFAGTVDNTASRLDLARNKANRMATILGDKVKPYADMAAKAIGGVADAVSAWAERHPRLTGAAMALLGVVAGLLLLFGGFALAIAAVLAPFAALRLGLTLGAPLFMSMIGGIWGAVTATWAFTAALLANPLTWIVLAVVAAVALLAGAAFLIYRNWGPITAWFGGVWNSVKAFTSQALAFLTSAIMNFSPLGLFIRAFQAVWPFLSGLGAKFRTFGGQLILGIINGVLGGIPQLLATVMRVGGRLITAFKNKLGIHSPSRVFAQFGSYTMAGLAQGIDLARREPIESLGRVGAAMTGALAIGAGGPALASTAGGVGGPTIGGDTYNITVNPVAGMDAQAIADQVMKAIQKAQASKRRSEFRDDDE
ncbi:phage tail tape measure protein [Brevundimonas sp. UBA7664]|uniref:phage tail tape measure protein n=1 Tax=Brevundimonas sp. UBA7664 TaxID=1946141 RepID=UPI0025BBDE25|nr:phage tail tape measure protein [Brevundimonas sp. UBA7664]